MGDIGTGNHEGTSEEWSDVVPEVGVRGWTQACDIKLLERE